MTDATGTHSVSADEFIGTISVESYKTGDANGDGVINVSDFSSIAAYILGNTPNGFVAKVADVNGDNVINVSDLSAVAYMILHSSTESKSGDRLLARRKLNSVEDYSNTLYANAVNCKAGDQITLPICMKNDYDVTGFQFDIHLPDGITVAEDGEFPLAELSTARTTARKTNYFDSSYQKDGSLRVLCNSTGGYAFTGNDGEVAVVTLNIGSSMNDGEYEIQLKDIVMTDASGTHQTNVGSISSKMVVGATSYIRDAKIDSASQKIFSVNGIERNCMSKGINIIMSHDGIKKVVVR